MCGKFTQMIEWSELVRISDLLGKPSDVAAPVRTLTPMRSAIVVHLGGDGQRIATPMTWGFTDREAHGRRKPRHMHARGETVDRLPTFADAFHERRGIVPVVTFNEGKEIAALGRDGKPNGKTKTQQWTIEPQTRKQLFIGVIFDEFDVGLGLEREFVMVTTSPNALIGQITDRMPLVLAEDDLPLWLGELRAPIEDVLALIRTRESGQDWSMQPEGGEPPKAAQGELF